MAQRQKPCGEPYRPGATARPTAAADGRARFTMTGHIAGLLQPAALKQREGRSVEDASPHPTKKKASQKTGLSEPPSPTLVSIPRRDGRFSTI